MVYKQLHSLITADFTFLLQIPDNQRMVWPLLVSMVCGASLPWGANLYWCIGFQWNMGHQIILKHFSEWLGTEWTTLTLLSFSASEKPGKCPILPFFCPIPSGPRCRNDWECPGSQKCCSVNCVKTYIDLWKGLATTNAVAVSCPLFLSYLSCHTRSHHFLGGNREKELQIETPFRTPSRTLWWINTRWDGITYLFLPQTQGVSPLLKLTHLCYAVVLHRDAGVRAIPGDALRWCALGTHASNHKTLVFLNTLMLYIMQCGM